MSGLLGFLEESQPCSGSPRSADDAETHQEYPVASAEVPTPGAQYALWPSASVK